MTPANVGVMTPEERTKRIEALTNDLESTTAEWGDALADDERDRSTRALADLVDIIEQLRAIW